MQQTFKLEYSAVYGKTEYYYTSAINKSYAYNFAIDYLRKRSDLKDLIAVVPIHNPTMEYEWLY